MMPFSAKVCLGRTLQFLSPAYLVFLIAFGAGRDFLGETHWLPVLLLYAPPRFYLLPALILLIPSLIRRSLPAIAMNILSLLIGFLWIMQPRLLPIHPPSVPSLKIVTWNIHGGTPGGRQSVILLRNIEADIILLQEARSPGSDRYLYPLRAIQAAFPGWHFARAEGNALLSRFPIVDSKAYPLGRYRKCLLAHVRIGEQTVGIINVHLNTAGTGESLLRSGRSFGRYLVRSAAVRKEQTDALTAILNGEKGPAIVAGDFNSPPHTYPYRLLAGRLQNAFDAGGFGLGYTFSANRPQWRIDHIFVGPEFRTLRCRTIRTGASDHLPVVAEVAYPSGSSI